MQKLSHVLEQIEHNQTKIAQYGKFDDKILKKINYKLRLDWNYYSNRMEGGTLTREETRSVMVGNVDVQGKPFKDVAEMAGHDKLVLEVLKMSKGELRISERRIKEIHKAIMYEASDEDRAKIGQWKTTPNEIINYKNEKIAFTAPSEVHDEVHQLLNEVNAELDQCFIGKTAIHPVVIASQFHIDFITIHPFYDGNGRTTRILTNILLMALGYPAIIVKEDKKKMYYQLLADIQAYGGSPDLFHIFIGERILETQQIVLDALEGKNIEEENDWKKDITLWKQSLTSEDNGFVKRSDELKLEVYTSSLRPLFLTTIEESKIFDDLFVEKHIHNGMDNYSFPVLDVNLFDDWAAYINPSKKKYSKAALALFTATDDLATKLAQISGLEERYKNVNFNANNDLIFEVNFIGFRLNGTRSFDQTIGLRVQFDRFKYIVMDRHRKVTFFEKLYSEKLTKNEIESLVKTLMKDTHKQMKELTDTKL